MNKSPSNSRYVATHDNMRSERFRPWYNLIILHPLTNFNLGGMAVVDVVVVVAAVVVVGRLVWFVQVLDSKFVCDDKASGFSCQYPIYYYLVPYSFLVFISLS